MMRLAKVIKVHPQNFAVDLVFLDSGWFMPGVQVLLTTISTCSGMVDLPSPVVDENDPRDTTLLGDTDILAATMDLGGRPVVIGFLPPQVTQMANEKENYRMFRHISDVTTSIDQAGNVIFRHPSGTTIHIGQSVASGEQPEEEDREGSGYHGTWTEKKNKSKGGFVLAVNGGDVVVKCDDSGNIKITAGTSIALETPLEGGTITLDGAVYINGILQVGD